MAGQKKKQKQHKLLGEACSPPWAQPGKLVGGACCCLSGGMGPARCTRSHSSPGWPTRLQGADRQVEVPLRSLLCQLPEGAGHAPRKCREQTPCGQTLTTGSGNQHIIFSPFLYPDGLYQELQTLGKQNHENKQQLCLVQSCGLLITHWQVCLSPSWPLCPLTLIHVSLGLHPP